ncbi:hypothetical protein [Kingella negevensis]|nr:hypothetical protein [Kingella negevensis]MDK4681044.1 hypothetical protein [Kingella negevensis]MDK4683246.1 hypothetical protein [Kingella negevensis]MDK4691622.1 hypothetical protein [Kingella negevensis]MDK4693227.1 hypothetical protein [Kingella negevensis]MDK4699527.1 hypothetical protein [Kingella negevensis]
MNWTEKRFTELTPTQIHQIYRERIAVFVVEQTCLIPKWTTQI